MGFLCPLVSPSSPSSSTKQAAPGPALWTIATAIRRTPHPPPCPVCRVMSWDRGRLCRARGRDWGEDLLDEPHEVKPWRRWDAGWRLWSGEMGRFLLMPPPKSCSDPRLSAAWVYGNARALPQGTAGLGWHEHPGRLHGLCLSMVNEQTRPRSLSLFPASTCPYRSTPEKHKRREM